MFVEGRKKKVENGCFGRMYEGCVPPHLFGGERTIAMRGGDSGEHKRKTIFIGNLRFVASTIDKNLLAV